MAQLQEIIVIYLFGGITFIPIILLIFLYFSSPVSSLPLNKKEEQNPLMNTYALRGKKGWIRLTKTYKPKGGSVDNNVAVIMSGIQSYVQGSKRPKENVYAELKCGALFIYETDQPQEECKIIIPVHNYTVSIYPQKPHQDHDIFSKSVALKLTPKSGLEMAPLNSMEVLLKNNEDGSYLTTNNELYITCTRPVDKEDWYFGLLAATTMMEESPESHHMEMVDITHFDLSAMQTLIATVQQDAEYREVQWLNAILGRLFLGLYKTNEMRHFFQEKISKKARKVKRPSFLGDITVQSVDIGHSIPFVTQPKLLSLTPEGDLMAEATVNYAGGLRVVIQTDFTWTYSSLMKPIRVPLVLSVTLKKMSGKVLLKVKPPPTNRCWVGFYEMPVMDWEITPIVSDKQIRFSMVTNAIQSKIREFMMQNIVLPNMDDLPFCPSEGKGGIFGERVPKPSSPNRSSSSSTASSTCTATTSTSNHQSGINLDMLGNKVNTSNESTIKKAPPKIQVTHQKDEQLDILLLPKPPTRRAESVGILLETKSPLEEVISSPDNKPAISRLRGYSNPSLPRRSNTQSMDTSAAADDNLPIVQITSPKELLTPSSATISASTGRRLASNIGFRKRAQQLQVEDDSIIDSRFSFETEDTLSSIASDILTKSIHKEIQKPVIKEAIQQQHQRQIYNDSMDSNFSTASAKTTRSSNHSLLSKFSTVGKFSSAAKLNINTGQKKSSLYNMAGNLFSNKKRVTKEMRDERNRELQESHNRKMMHLFLSPEAEQKMPPALPPRPIMTVEREVSSLSSSSSEENLTASPSSSCSAELDAFPMKSPHQQCIQVVDEQHTLSHHQNIQQQPQQQEDGLCL
jgi:hypothetical protein